MEKNLLKASSLKIRYERNYCPTILDEILSDLESSPSL